MDDADLCEGIEETFYLKRGDRTGQGRKIYKAFIIFSIVKQHLAPLVF